jgi:hypothetical protein
MGSLFLFISLAVLVGIVGLLAYYFKSRLADVESKNMKSLEIIEGVYSQQQQMKQYILNGGIMQQQQQQQQQQQHQQYDNSQYDERIKIVLEENDDDEEEESDEEESEESEDEESDEEESEDESDKIKTVTVDMSFPAECELEIDEDEDEYIPEDEPEVNIDEQLNQTDEIVVTKMDAVEESKPEESHVASKDEYKKMSITALKNILHSRGIITDSARLNKMKKSEIIDLLLVASLAQ